MRPHKVILSMKGSESFLLFFDNEECTMNDDFDYKKSAEA